MVAVAAAAKRLGVGSGGVGPRARGGISGREGARERKRRKRRTERDGRRR